jgi:hypothetical protein
MKKTIKHQISNHKRDEIIKETGIAGYGAYWFLEESLHTARGNALFYSDEDINTLAGQINTTVKEIQKVIKVCLKLRLFYIEGTRLFTEALRRDISPEMSEKRKKAHLAGLKKRLENKAKKLNEIIVVDAEVLKPEASKAPAKVKKAPAIKKEPKIKQPISDPEPEAPLLELKIEEAPKKVEAFKEWQFSALFNEIRTAKKPNARGMLALSPTDKSNFKKLIDAGYKKEDFVLAISGQMESEYVMENGLDTPEHILRIGNFQRYISKSSKPVNTGKFSNKETIEPDFK